VRDLRVPAARITSVGGATGIEEILRVAADNDRTRLLVLEGDSVPGSVPARDALVTRAQGRTTNTRGLARPVPELGEDTTVVDVIDVERRQRASLAVVRDETGRLTGMATLDDLLSRFLQPQAA
jgi:CBS domain containing-hemolysin-like protein